MTIQIIENGYIVMRGGLPIRYFPDVTSAMKFEDGHHLDIVCPSTGQACQHLSKVSSGEGISIMICAMTGYEVDMGHCPMHDSTD